MFKVGDFSRLGQVSVRMLRHCDKLGLPEPTQIDPHTGYRYYAIDQLARLNRIQALNGLGLTLQRIMAMHELALYHNCSRSQQLCRQHWRQSDPARRGCS